MQLSSDQFIETILTQLQTAPEASIGLVNDLVHDYEIPREHKYELLVHLSNYSETIESGNKSGIIESLSKELRLLQQKKVAPKPSLEVVAREKKVLFSCSKICKEYQSSTQFKLSKVSFDLLEGEITAVVGENGNGKSTLCKIIAGLLLEDSGKLMYPGLGSPGKEHNWLELKQRIIYLPQELRKTSGSVEENLIFEGRIAGISVENIHDTVAFYIQRLGLFNYKQAHWNELSGGYRLRFQLALCLIRQPKLLILDEPLGNLDIKAQADLLYDLRQLANSEVNPMSIIITSQHIDEIEHIADNIVYLENGEAIMNCKIKDIGGNQSCFELRSVNISSNTLFELFKEHGLYKTYMTNIGQAMIFDRMITFYDVSKILYRAKVPITYLRDITHSSKKVFYFGV